MAMDEQERQEFAEKLVELSYKKARKEVRRRDKDADLKFWRNSVGDGEIQTLYECPNLGVRVRLVEISHAEKQDNGSIKKEYIYSEARVEPLS